MIAVSKIDQRGTNRKAKLPDMTTSTRDETNKRETYREAHRRVMSNTDSIDSTWVRTLAPPSYAL